MRRSVKSRAAGSPSSLDARALFPNPHPAFRTLLHLLSIMATDAERQPLLSGGPSPHIPSGSSGAGRLASRLKHARAGLRESLAELLGTFLLVLIGECVAL